MAQRADLQSLRNMIEEAHSILEATTLPEGRSESARDILSTALKLTDQLLLEEPSGVFGSIGG